jgi:hypothetical protein
MQLSSRDNLANLRHELNAESFVEVQHNLIIVRCTIYINVNNRGVVLQLSDRKHSD